MCAAEVSWDVYCERVKGVCCGFRGRGRMNPPLSLRADRVTGANGSKITWLSAQHIEADNHNLKSGEREGSN